jgi:acyl-CoA thioesterase
MVSAEASVERASPAADAPGERLADLRWLGIEVADAEIGPDGVVATRASVVLVERHLTQQRLYGGAGLSLVGALIEAASGRPLRWATTQFVGTPKGGVRLDLVAELLAAGRRTSQVRVTGRVDGRIVLTGLGAAGDPDPRIPDGVVARMPVVPAPEDCRPFELVLPPGMTPGFFGLTEIREFGEGPRLRFWIRFTGRPATRPAMLPLVADSVPTMVMAALGQQGSGTSLDNTIRVGTGSDSEWVLVDGVPEQAAGGYGYGAVRLWAQDGSLAGVGSQTATLRLRPPTV